MCTSLTLPLPDGSQLFGRTLDWHEHFDEKILHVPQGFSLKKSNCVPGPLRYAILGTGQACEGYPLFFDGMNEAGLCMAGLRFAASAHYLPTNATPPTGFVSLAPWEMIPYVLGFCDTPEAAKDALSRVRVVDRPFPLAAGGEIPNAPLHWHIADGRRGGSLVVEATARGLSVYDAPLGVMTNDPAYPEQVAAYERAVEAHRPLPSGYDSTARFVRAATLRRHTADALAAHMRWKAAETAAEIAAETAETADAAFDPVPEWFPEPTEGGDAAAECAHALDGFFGLCARVSPPAGEVPAARGDGWQTTLYTCCMDGARGLYHCVTADTPTRRTVTFFDAPEMMSF